MSEHEHAVFIRHNLHLPKGGDTLRKIWDARVIALDYEPLASTNPADYGDQGRKALQRMWNYCRDGAIVGADYSRFCRTKMLCGVIQPGSQVRVQQFDGYSFYKVVQLTTVREVSYLKYPVLLSLQPRLAALTSWPRARDKLEAAWRGDPLPAKVQSLDHNQLEVLCYEYLRKSGVVESLLLPIGRTMQNIDVLGLSPRGERVVAQVTFSADVAAVQSKLDSLCAFESETASLYFFCPRSAIPANPKCARFVAIEDAFDYFGDASPMIKQMLGVT